MISEIKIIHQLSVNGIFEVTDSTESDLKAWIANGHYLVSKPLIASTKNRTTEFELAFNKNEILYASLANDCNRFAQAAIESMWSVGCVSKLPKSTCWAAIQMYYSAFFAAHALLRVYGRACSQLAGDHVAKVLEIASATQLDGGVVSIEDGFYSSLIVGNQIAFSKLKDTHADTWLSFSELLRWLSLNIINTQGLSSNKLKAIDLVDKIKKVLHKSGANKGNWLSQIRNKINYNHAHGTWHPYKNSLHDKTMVLRNKEWFNSVDSFDLDINNEDIILLHNVSNAILSLMYHLLNYGYERSGKKSLPLRNGTFRLINQLQS